MATEKRTVEKRNARNKESFIMATIAITVASFVKKEEEKEN